MNVLVVKPSSLGDVVHAFPAVQLLRQALPEAVVSWLVNDTYAELVELCADIDEVIVFRRRRWGRPRHWPELVGFVRELRQRHFELVVDLQGLLRTGLITWLTAAPRRVGLATAKEGAHYFYNEKILLPGNVLHAVDRNLLLIQSALHFPAGEATAYQGNLRPSPDGSKRADILFRMHRLDGQAPVVAVAPAARWMSKAFAPGFFAAVIDAVAQVRADCQFWILGTADEQSIGEAVVDQCHRCVPELLMGEANLVTLIEMLRRSAVLLTNDSGPMHLAAAIGRPTVALFGPTDPSLTGPYGQGHAVLRGHCANGPCFERSCPQGPKQRCTNGSLSVDAAAAAVLQRLPPG